VDRRLSRTRAVRHEKGSARQSTPALQPYIESVKKKHRSLTFKEVCVVKSKTTSQSSSADTGRWVSADARHMSSTNVRIKLLSDAIDVTTVELIVKASADPLIVDATYLPAGLDEKTVFEWASSQKPYAWVL
jgi:hypothetical protein